MVPPLIVYKAGYTQFIFPLINRIPLKFITPRGAEDFPGSVVYIPNCTNDTNI